MGKARGQAAVEYIIIVAIVMLFLIPIWTYVTSTHRQASNELTLTYAKNAASQIADAADLVYSQGPPAKVKINVYIPYGVENATIINETIVMEVRTDSSITDVFGFSNARLNGTLPVKKGNYQIEIEAVDDMVQIGLA